MTFLALLFIFISLSCFSQTVYEEVTHKPVYAFMDEMANAGIIDVYSAAKPYSRKRIAGWLEEVHVHQHRLTLRQRKELLFYLQEFDMERNTLEDPFLNFLHISTPGYQFNFGTSSMRYRDSLFQCSVRPILGLQYGNNQYGTISHFWYGAEGFAYIGDFAMYASIRENDEEHRILSDPVYLNPRKGAIYTNYDDYTEARGGITYTWDWGHAGLVKDYIQWGTHYHYPLVFSGKAPSFTQVKYEIQPLEWLTFRYFHAWLAPDAVDTAANITNEHGGMPAGRTGLRKKFLAAHMIGFKLLKHSYVSLGNSVVYSHHRVEPGFLFPLFTYRSYNSTVMLTGKGADELVQNAQLFVDISFREIRNVHVYGTLLLDDFKFSRFRDKNTHNLYGLNLGLQVSNVVPNTFLTLEYYYAKPLVYQHAIAAVVFASNGYYMGHYLRDNSEQIYGQLAFRPFQNAVFRMDYMHAIHGPDYGAGSGYRTELPFMDRVDWKRRTWTIGFSYQVMYNVSLYGSLANSFVSGKRAKYTLPFYHGNTQTLSAGFQYGF